jgi:hypothetical protein
MRRRPWQEVPQPVRRRLRAIYHDLNARYDLRDRLTYRLAKQVCELWLVVEGVSLEAAQTSEQRRWGKGRKATRLRVNATAKRQGQHLETLTKTLERLEALAGKHGTHTNPLIDLARSASRPGRPQ